MKTRAFYVILACLLGFSFLACGSGDQKAAIEQLEEQFRTLTQQPGVNPEEVKASMRELAEAYIAYAESQSEATKAGEFLYRAAELYETNMLDPQAAIGLLDRIIEDYPSHERAADALFKKGYVYHNILNDLPRAREAYMAFLEAYPDHDLVASAKFEIENLGVPADELLRRIQSADTSGGLAPESP
ncbi:MAG: hypothetical protein D6722_08185 [Bacteroidetes bacterium]|nr:MAG: hypothetical protein D6722_08185 [Bacteroidota bacterium]